MSERGILFSAPMVLAILNGTKTQTRRVVKLPPAPEKLGHWEPFWFGGEGCKDSRGNPVSGRWTIGHSRTGAIVGCQHGSGDQLWVREAWRTLPSADRLPPRDLMNLEGWIHYEADESKPRDMGKLRPSLFMPRWASRITLEITDVRCERLQDISDADALAEGVDRTNTSIVGYAKQRYQNLWNSINGKDSWDENPFVWVVEFKRVPADPLERINRLSDGETK